MEISILFLPLVASIIAGFFGKYIGDRNSEYVTSGLVSISALLSIFVLYQVIVNQYEENIVIATWINSGSLDVNWSMLIDPLSAVMLVVVTSVSSLVHIYSIGYMSHDPHKPRFMAYLSLFTFAMLMLVTSDNFIQLFFGWEGVGLCSYFLIGFWFKKESANAAAIKAFVVNRVGDFGFALGIFLIFYLFGTVNYSEVFQQIPTVVDKNLSFLGFEIKAIDLICLLLFIGAMGKSAQILLHTWLPDAMEGPTPVSALIHAATMVTAGVFMVCRLSPLMEYATFTPNFIVLIGATTAFFAATVGLVQNDIKRVIAYSTCSQLGYMFVAAGVGAYGAAMFHLFTHAFFKAMLFLGAGSVIHAMHHEQDMRNYGALRKKIPYTFAAMMIGTLAITGVGIPLTHYGFAGFLSKDAIIESAYGAGTGVGQYAFVMLVVAAAMTSFYSWRLIFLTFYGKARGNSHTHDHAHESPLVMILPLAVLALGAVFSGMIWYEDFFGDHWEEFFGSSLYANHETNHVVHDAHYVANWVKASPFFAMLFGFIMAMWFYIWAPENPAKLAKQQNAVYLFFLNKWYFDELYEIIFVRPSKWLGNFLWKRGDGSLIDGGINGIALGIIPLLTRKYQGMQSGYLFHYAFTMVIGVAVIVTWFALTGGSN